MARRTLSLVFKVVRMSAGFALVAWGLVGLAAFFLPLLPGLSAAEWGAISVFIILLPGGIWCVFLGLALLARDIPIAKRFELWLKFQFGRLRACLQKKFPRFDAWVIVPVGKLQERISKKIKSLFKRDKKEG
ncbi:MAG: hypothetical protein WAP51_04855 [Candidatus Sungiibacteriota bacterium]